MADDDPLADRGPGIKIMLEVMLPLTIVIVALRFWSRALITGRRFWWDDWLCLSSLPFWFWIAGASFPYVDKGGMGRHIDTLPPQQVEYGLRLFYGSFYPYQISITLPKLSCVMFYARVFTHTNSKALHRNLWTLGVLIVLNSLASILAATFQCTPIRRYWDRAVPGSCINIALWQVLHAVTNLIFDLYILLLPMPILLKLQTTRKKRALIITIFALGYGVALVSIGALISIVIPGESFIQDYTWASVPPLYFELLEPSTAIVCICLPSISHFIRQVQKGGVRSIFTVKPPTHPSSAAKRSEYPSGKRSGGFMRLGGRTESGEQIDLPHVGPAIASVQAVGAKHLDIEGQRVDAAHNMHEIHVRRDFEVTVETIWDTM